MLPTKQVIPRVSGGRQSIGTIVRREGTAGQPTRLSAGVMAPIPTHRDHMYVPLFEILYKYLEIDGERRSGTFPCTSGCRVHIRYLESVLGADHD